MIWLASEAEEFKSSSSSAAAAINVRRRVDTGIWFRYKQGVKKRRRLANDGRAGGGGGGGGKGFLLEICTSDCSLACNLHGAKRRRRV